LNIKTSFYLEAKEVAKTGDFDKAWEIAKTDNSLLSHVTKECWIKWCKDILAK
jgi:hypothetical protein